MTASPRFETTLHRIEVHGGPLGDQEFVWHLTAAPADGGRVFIWGYMRSASPEGFGQAQVVGVTDGLDWREVTKNSTTRKEFSTWVEEYAGELMYDCARRALHSQAAMMDSALEIPKKSPSNEIEFLKSTPKKVDTRKSRSISD